MKKILILIPLLIILAVCSISAQNNNARYTPKQVDQITLIGPTKSTATPVQPTVDTEQLAIDIQMKQDIIDNGGNELESEVVVPENWPSNVIYDGANANIPTQLKKQELQNVGNTAYSGQIIIPSFTPIPLYNGISPNVKVQEAMQSTNNKQVDPSRTLQNAMKNQ